MWKEGGHCLQTTVYLAESFDEPVGKGVFEMRHSFLCFCSLVRIYELLYANSRPLAYDVRISSKACATAECTALHNGK